ncbi:prolyl oligopeptidase family serine peptidase [Roseivirga pacifica]|uniref:alpha/beta hydrolase family protein n=1 Tax=Roseivirga pacifica TaxID=1267423 RepID=UPI003BB15436
MQKITSKQFFTLLLALLCIGQLARGQEKKPLTLADYGQWNSIRNTAISPNGEWMTYSYVPNDGDSKLYVRKIDGDTVSSAVNGKRVSFSDDNLWVAYLTDLPEKEAEKLKKQGKPATSTFELYNLNAKSVQQIENVKTFGFSNASNYVAIHKNAADKKAEHEGSDLIIKDLKGNNTLNIGNVSSFAFNETGSLFAYLVDADGKAGNGLFVVDLNGLRTFPVHAGDYTYSQLAWNEAGDGLAVLFGTKPEGKVQRENTLAWANGLASGMSATPSLKTFSSTNGNGFPENHVISEYSSLSWNDAGSQIFFGIKEQDDEVKKEDELKANVDVWHWKDDEVQSRQIVMAGRDRRATFTSVLNLESGKFVQLQTEDMSFVRTSDKSKWAVASVDKDYRAIRNQPSGYADLYAINTTSGAKQLIAKNVYHDLGVDPMGRYAAYTKDTQVQLYHFDSGKTTNINANSDVDFENLEFDYPVERPVYGIAGWSKDGNWVFMNHKYDIYAFSLNSNEVINLTQGMGNENEIRFRLTRLDPETDTYDTSKPLLMSVYGEWTKQSGYYEVTVGKKPKVLHFIDKMVGRPTKAKDANVIMYTEQTFEEFPDLWVASTDFKKPKKITNANPQQEEYKWGRRVLVDYTDKRGHKLQATLALPADYEEGKKYPMVIYFYEKMSQRHHQYSMPTYDDRPHMSTYASNGYLVLMPDIVYDMGKPGSSALDDVTSAAKAVIELGYADPQRIGLQGHSWGGYESSFILTQTDMFACVVTGAPLTNLISMYNVAYKRSGNLNGPIIEWSQGRMGVSPWNDMELYRSQSPIHHAEKINTPFLILHGTADGAVDWNQGLEYYQTARRLGKEVILLSYPDEPHHLTKEANQKDFQIRMKQYFDHYLMDADAPVWLSNGVSNLDKKRVKPEDMGEGK